MSERENQQDLEGLMDSLLAEYSDVAPRPGMETRLLATLRAETAAQAARRGLWRWIFAGAGALAVTAAVFGVFGVVAIYVSIPPLPAPPKISAAGPPRLPASPAHPVAARDGVISAAAHRALSRPRGTVQAPQADERAAAGVESVRQEIFPTPTPLSEQERLLFRYQAEFPKEKLAVLTTPGEAQDGSGPMLLQPQQFVGPEGQSIR